MGKCGNRVTWNVAGEVSQTCHGKQAGHLPPQKCTGILDETSVNHGIFKGLRFK